MCVFGQESKWKPPPPDCPPPEKKEDWKPPPPDCPPPAKMEAAPAENEALAPADAGVHLDVYTEALRVMVLKDYLTVTDVRHLAQLRQQRSISEAQHMSVLANLGLTQTTFEDLLRKGNKMSNISTECVVCMDGVADHIILKCMHLCLCKKCVPGVLGQGKCPKCRAPAVDILKTFS